MKKLLNTLYVMNEEAYLSLDGENIVVSANKNVLGRIPLHTLENVVCFSYKGSSPALMGACAARGVGKRTWCSSLNSTQINHLGHFMINFLLKFHILIIDHI